jgi:hypothetical protein
MLENAIQAAYYEQILVEKAIKNWNKRGKSNYTNSINLAENEAHFFFSLYNNAQIILLWKQLTERKNIKCCFSDTLMPITTFNITEFCPEFLNNLERNIFFTCNQQMSNRLISSNILKKDSIVL